MKKILFLICLFSLSFYSCAIRNSLAPKVGLDAERTFTAQMMKGGESVGYFNIPAKLIKTTDHLAIYLQNGKNVSLYALNEMAQEFDYYYDDMTNIYGEHPDIDGNGKIIILLMQINTESKGNGSINGYYNPYDMYAGNSGEVLYMEAYKVDNQTEEAIGTLIHEFQHLINYNYYLSGKRRPMSSWLNEALSESTSVLFNKATAESRINSFNGISYYCFYTWNLPNSYGFANYPSVSVFMHWLYNTNGGKYDIFSNIAHSKESSDCDKVLTSAKKIISSLKGWDDLLLTWMSNVVSSGIPSHWSANVEATNRTITGATNLYPGAMVVYNNGYNGSSGNNNIETRKANGKTIVLNKDTTLGDAPPYIPVNPQSATSTTKSKARQISSKKEEPKNINILLDKYGNIQEY